eukprot:18866-Prorocentrum_minimum.AAC.2
MKDSPARRSPPGLPPLASTQLHHGVATIRDSGFPSSVLASPHFPGMLRVAVVRTIRAAAPPEQPINSFA